MSTLSSLRQHTATGAYVELSCLQQLRHVAKQCSIAKSNNSKALLGGAYKSRAVSRGMEFEEVRQYQPGDDIRSIDWRVTARTQVTHSKCYTEEKEKPIITAVDQRHSSFFGSHPCFKSVYACHLAALINWTSLLAGDRSGGIVLGSKNIEETRAMRSHKTVNRWLQQLCRANQQLASTSTSTAEPPLSELLKRIIHTTQTGTHIYIISDFYDVDPACEKWLFSIAKHHQLTLLWVVDQLETSLPESTHLTISNGQTHHPVIVSPETITAFHQQFTAKADYLTKLTQRLRIQLIRASVQTAPADIITGSLSL